MLSDDPHDQARFARRSALAFLGKTAWLPRAEDVVVWKLRWALRANRAKDREDAFMVLLTQWPNLDLEYMTNWCRQHGTLELLERLLGQVREAEAG
jgi:hypothetical protein